MDALGLLQEPLYGNSSEANCSCDMEPRVTVLFQDLPICNIALLPTWLLALVIGVAGGMTISKLGPTVVGSQSYSTTFFMYAAMITSGFVAHSLFLAECGAGPVSEGFILASEIDLCLTVCIAISFIFNGLVDLRLLHEDEFCSSLLMWLTYITVFLLEFGQYVEGWTLYMGSIVVGCPTYLLCQLVVLYRSKNRIDPLLYLTAAGVVGGVSFILFSKFLCELCLELGAWSIQYTLCTRSPSKAHLQESREKHTPTITKNALLGYSSISHHITNTDKTPLPKPA